MPTERSPWVEAAARRVHRRGIDIAFDDLDVC
jgi:hypothetical protein